MVDAIYIGSKGICGLFFITFFYAGTTAALLVGLSEYFDLPPTIRSRIPGWLRSSPSDTSNGQQTDEAEPSERTPLIQNGHHSKPIDGQEELGVWFIQFLLAVPFPLILISQVGLMLLNSLNQTLVDGSPASVGTCMYHYSYFTGLTMCYSLLGCRICLILELRTTHPIRTQSPSLCGERSIGRLLGHSIL